MKLNFQTVDARAGKVPDGLYRVKPGLYMWIKGGVFHFPLSAVDPALVFLQGYPVAKVWDLHAQTWRFFIRASHCLEMYPADAADINTIVARYGAQP